MKTIFKCLFVLLIGTSMHAQENTAIQNEVVSGIILDEDGKPFPNVYVLVKGHSEETRTDSNGNYRITAQTNDILEFSFAGYTTAEVAVNDSSTISLSMEANGGRGKEEITTALGIKKHKDEIATAYQVVKTEALVQANNPDVMQSLAGKVSNLQVFESGGGPSSIKKIILRSGRSMKGDNSALIVIDGAISSTAFLQAMDPNSIASINVLKGANGAALYGGQASNGAIVVTTKRPVTDKTSASRKNLKRYSGRLKVKSISNKTEYIKALSVAKTAEEAFEIYKAQKEQYKGQIGYYPDVYRYFNAWPASSYSKDILNDVLASNYDDHELLRALAYELESQNKYDLASSIYKRILMLRPQDAQSYRDLALVYQALGKHQKAFELLNSILSEAVYQVEGSKKINSLNRISKNEVNALIQKDSSVDMNGLETYNKIDTRFDLRVVIDWNREHTDIDLHVIDPSNEHCFKSNPRTKSGGEVSEASNAGFGPEEFTIRQAKSGDYYIKLSYNNISESPASGPTYVKITTYKNFGMASETKLVQVIRLAKEQGAQMVAKVSI